MTLTRNGPSGPFTADPTASQMFLVATAAAETVTINAAGVFVPLDVSFSPVGPLSGFVITGNPGGEIQFREPQFIRRTQVRLDLTAAVFKVGALVEIRVRFLHIPASGAANTSCGEMSSQALTIPLNVGTFATPVIQNGDRLLCEVANMTNADDLLVNAALYSAEGAGAVPM